MLPSARWTLNRETGRYRSSRLAALFTTSQMAACRPAAMTPSEAHGLVAGVQSGTALAGGRAHRLQELEGDPDRWEDPGLGVPAALTLPQLSARVSRWPLQQAGARQAEQELGAAPGFPQLEDGDWHQSAAVSSLACAAADTCSPWGTCTCLLARSASSVA